VATDLASRGIHVEKIAHVINYDLPELAENFIHRVGRTGRAGLRGTASTLFQREQRADVSHLERQLGIHFERIEVDGLSRQQVSPMATESARSQPRRKSTIVQLPGEVLQLQMA
jgi:superfamily II DNA/RNA helicase